MTQRYNPNKENLNAELKLIDSNLSQMLELAYIHEDMVVTIESLMNEWCKMNLSIYKDYEKEWSQLAIEEKKYGIDIWLNENGTWWLNTFNQLNDSEKEKYILRYRATIACCLHSDTYDEDDIKRNL